MTDGPFMFGDQATRIALQIMIEPNQSDIGRKVVFRVYDNAKVEEGAITRLNRKYVFVRFGKEEKSAVMTRDELERKRPGSSRRTESVSRADEGSLARKTATASAARSTNDRNSVGG